MIGPGPHQMEARRWILGFGVTVSLVLVVLASLAAAARATEPRRRRKS